MAQNTVLIVEDDEGLREALVDTLMIAGYQWIEADSAESALLQLKKHSVDIVITDVQMAGMGGLALLRTIKQHWPNLPVLLMTAYANIEDAVAAMKEGAIDYMAKPFAPEVLLNMVSRYVPAQSAENSETVVADEQSIKLLKLADKVAKTDASVMVLGPSGSGKEVLSRYIHNASLRSDGPFVAINCAAIPDNMLEATLFGYEKGAFTGAVQACPGKFEQAQGGTILLDEISEMDLNLQAKLLRVLQEREVERLGSRKSIQLDVRVLATSNRDLKSFVQEGHFREDLYYRLNVFPIAWPALKDRPGDIEPLANHLLSRHCSKSGMPVPKLGQDALKKLLAHPWPGNVRELDNVIQRALILAESDCIDAGSILLEGLDWQQFGEPEKASSDAISQSLLATPPTPLEESKSSENLGSELREQEYAIILETLVACDGRRKEMAEKLGISPRTLRYKLAKMRDAGIEFPG
ncbi:MULTISPECIES: sigma-54 dependent transcriptional regulator [unclassified Vibrio]|uniref:Sigma-54-dependent transcriptional regulator n=1 Tax=Vibrio sp. HB236076 TaxID=3232307 RepID=A0AB39HI12_9VIBR|nr:sigma-54 dependent transcriptional regulator [Vibrio sp. HB161653]MDP5254802.1 sigma-54 dependent transcriptional regulator [Vibrio sp. HB161653]